LRSACVLQAVGEYITTHIAIQAKDTALTRVVISGYRYE